MTIADHPETDEKPAGDASPSTREPSLAAIDSTPSLRQPLPAFEGEARRFVRDILGRGHIWPAGDGDKIGIRLNQGECDLEKLNRLRPEILAVLREKKLGPPRLDPSPSTPSRLSAVAARDTGSVGNDVAAGIRPAARVADADRGRVRRLIGGLALADNSWLNKDTADSHPLSAQAAHAIAVALGDDKATSRATFRGLAGDVLLGELAVGCLHAAFDEACAKGKRNRGASFIAAVKRWKSENVRRRPSPWPSLRS